MSSSSYISYNHPSSSPTFEQSKSFEEKIQRERHSFISSPIDIFSHQQQQKQFEKQDQEQIRTWEQDQAEIKLHFEQRERDRLAGKDQESFVHDPFDRFDEMGDDRQRISHYTTNDLAGFPQQLYSFAALRLEADGQTDNRGGYINHSSAFIAPPSDISQGLTSPATSPHVGFGTSPTTTSPASFSSHMPSSPIQLQNFNNHFHPTQFEPSNQLTGLNLPIPSLPSDSENQDSSMMIRHASQPVHRDPHQDWQMSHDGHYADHMSMNMNLSEQQVFPTSMPVPFPNQIQVPVLQQSTKTSRKKKKTTRATHEKSHARKRPEGYVKRPQNSFILYRTHVTKNNLIPEEYQINRSQDKSRIIGMMWKSLSEEERKPWEELSKQTHEEHLKLFPSYRYKPEMVKKDKSKRNLKTPEDIEKTCEEIADSILRSQGREGLSKERIPKRKANRKRSKTVGEVENVAGPSRSSSRKYQPKTRLLRSSVRSGRKSDSSDKTITEEKPLNTTARGKRKNKGKQKANDEPESEGETSTFLPVLDPAEEEFYHSTFKPMFSNQDKEEGEEYQMPDLTMTSRRRSSSLPTGMQASHLKPFFSSTSLSGQPIHENDVERIPPASALPSYLSHVEDDPIAAAAVAAVTSNAQVSDASIELFASWQERIAQAAHQAAETNIYSNSSPFDVQFHGMPSARSFSADNVLSSAMGHHFAFDMSNQDQTISEQDQAGSNHQYEPKQHDLSARPHTSSACTSSATSAKKRPERLALAKSNLDALPAMSPRSMAGSTLTPLPALTPRHHSDFTPSTTQSALAREANMEQSISHSDLQYHQERPHTSYAIRNGQDSMLISPANETMEDLRRTSLTGNNWQSLAMRKSRLSQFDVALPVMQSRLSIGSGSQMTTPTAFPPTPLTAKFNPFRFASGTFINGMESRRNSLLMEDHSDHH